MNTIRDAEKSCNPIGAPSRKVVLSTIDATTDPTARKQLILGLYEHGFFTAHDVAILFAKYSDLKGA